MSLITAKVFRGAVVKGNLHQFLCISPLSFFLLNFSHSCLDTPSTSEISQSHPNFPPVICRDDNGRYWPVGVRVEYYAEPEPASKGGHKKPVKLSTKYFVLPQVQRDPITGQLTELTAGYWTEARPPMIPPSGLHPPEVPTPTPLLLREERPNINRRLKYYRHRGTCEKIGGCCGWGLDNLAKCAFNIVLDAAAKENKKQIPRG